MNWEERQSKLTALGEALGLGEEMSKEIKIVDSGETFLDVAPTEAGNGAPVEPASVSLTFRHSATFGQLCKALCAASLEFKEITKDTENKYFGNKYADLSDLIKATRPALAKHGIYVIQPPQMAVEKAVTVTTMLMHVSNEWLAADLEIPLSKADAQGIGSAVTYGRRYSYAAILNIAAEEDDDGNAAVGRSQKDRQSRSDEVGPGTINPVQMRAFQSACKTGKKTDEEVLEYLGSRGYESLEEVPKAQFDTVIKWALSK